MNPISKSKNILDTMFCKIQEPFLVNSEKIDMVRSMWADEESRIAYDREIIYKILEPLVGFINAQSVSKSGPDHDTFIALGQKALYDPNLPKIAGCTTAWSIGRTLAPFYLQQYQYKNLVLVHPHDIVLDCGACAGDTAMMFVLRHAGKIYAFEPNTNNLHTLAETLKLNNAADYVESVPKALGKAEKTVWLNVTDEHPGWGHVEDSRTDEGYPVQLTTIDIFCAEKNIHPNFIKMDIEGAEFDALSGAEQCIKTDHPDLAICLYHHPSDMWTIPLLIKNCCPKYRFYCKKSHFSGEFVFFATCRD